ncbi:hypothetical protein M405DRAFT_360442 [Rhizopogon salebrosus TDB-379]|nr:hypothetical protein M405DRAFT_360442 [Rhizopogon salebrosus TDB-379]
MPSTHSRSSARCRRAPQYHVCIPSLVAFPRSSITRNPTLTMLAILLKSLSEWIQVFSSAASTLFVPIHLRGIDGMKREHIRVCPKSTCAKRLRVNYY